MRPVCSMVLLAASTPTKRAQRSRPPGRPGSPAPPPAAARAMRAYETSCGGLDARLQLAGVLGREQALGDHQVEQHRQHQRRQRHQQRQPLAVEHPGRAPGRSGAITPVEAALGARGRGRSASRPRRPAFSQRADIIGTSVSETTAEIRIVIASVTANSRNRRPTTSPMNSSGISTAISETVSEMMVKPISRRALERGLHRRLALLDVARDVLDHHDRVVDDEAGGDRQRHQAQVVQAVAQQVHRAEGADQRDRHRQAGDQGRAQAAQEGEDHQHHQHHRQHQLDLDVLDRGADAGGAVGAAPRPCRLAGSAACRSGSCALDRVDGGDHVRARLALHVEDDRRPQLRRSLPAQAPSRVFSALSTTCATSTSRTGAPFL